MPKVTGIELEDDPKYLRKWLYHSVDGFDELISFNANCILESTLKLSLNGSD